MQTEATNPAAVESASPPAKYRDRVQIVAQILQAVNGNGGTTKTNVMYEAFLSYAQLKDYLKVLNESDLLQHDYNESSSHIFKITKKGIDFLKIYDEVEQAMKLRDEVHTKV
jgi:predicted transcriptional regulator